MIKMIVAVDRDNAIGHDDGRLPWKISADMKRFKALTTGGTVFMGRKTFQSLGRYEGLPNRKNIVLSSTPPDAPPNVIHVKDIEDLRFMHEIGADAWLIGGAQVYNWALAAEVVDELYITTVEMHSEAPVRLNADLYDYPGFVTREKEKGRQWQITGEDRHLDEEIPFSFITLRRLR